MPCGSYWLQAFGPSCSKRFPGNDLYSVLQLLICKPSQHHHSLQVCDQHISTGNNKAVVSQACQNYEGCKLLHGVCLGQLLISNFRHVVNTSYNASKNEQKCSLNLNDRLTPPGTSTPALFSLARTRLCYGLRSEKLGFEVVQPGSF